MKPKVHAVSFVEMDFKLIQRNVTMGIQQITRDAWKTVQDKSMAGNVSNTGVKTRVLVMKYVEIKK